MIKHCKRGHLRSAENVTKSGDCKQCRKIRDDEFKHRHPNKVYESTAIARKNWADKNPEYHRNWSLRKDYGITREQYEEFLVKQDNKCAICKAEFGTPFVDHDHFTQKVRGLLCRECNSGLGFFKDNPERLRHAADYLQEK
jgi:hypothetical protein